MERLGREPNGLELAVFSLMWSEHCAYKHSKKLLRRLPTEGPHVVMGPGENAGAVDVGDGLVVAFKVESHNHPSAVEPFQGAATGVGGILRDVFAIGARPIAVLDSLRFGELDSERSRFLFDWSVKGIGHYGNSIGVPTVGGEVLFEPAYEQNCLVNAMCVGIARQGALIRSAAAGVGQPARADGRAHGPRRHRRRVGAGQRRARPRRTPPSGPTVQIGDPFEEKKLLECCLELLDRGVLVALQDLGAAGLSSSSSEMASKGDVGLDIDVSKVPLREADMEPFEIMISESQERMLCVIEPGRLPELLEICERWEVRATAIGEVTDTERLRVLDGDEVVGDMPVAALVDDCPLYDLEPEEPSERIYPDPPARLDEDADPGERAAGAAGLAERGLQALRVRAVRLDRRLAHRAPPGGGRRRGAPARRTTAAAARSPSRSTATAGAWPAIPTPARSRPCSSARATSPAWAPSRSASPTASTSATPRSRTSPGSSRARWRASATPASRSACRWWAATCRSTTRARRARSTPRRSWAWSGASRIPSACRCPASSSRATPIALVGPFAPDLAGSELEKLRGRLADGLPAVDLERQAAGLAALRAAVRAGGLATVHDISEGGLACALAECCIAGGIGARVDLSAVGAGARSTARLFGEGPGGAVVAGPRRAGRARSRAPSRWA